MGRAPCCEKMGLRRGPWAPEEDQVLINHIQLYGHGNWRALPKQAGLSRCGKSCRLRWINYLRPDIKRGNFTGEEEETIIKLHEILGNKKMAFVIHDRRMTSTNASSNHPAQPLTTRDPASHERWSAIAARLPGRTDNEIKNVWHTHLKKRIKQNHAAPEVKRPRVSTSKSNQDSKTELESPNFSNPEGSEGSECRPISPQRCSSDISSAITEDINGNNVSAKGELLDHFLEMDDKFWTDWNDFTAVGTDPLIQYPLSPIINATEPLHGNNSNIQDSVDFWHSLLKEAGEFPGLL